MPAMLRNIPALGLTRELQVRCTNVVDAWADLVRVSGPYSMLVAGAATASAQEADMILVNGKIVTIDPKPATA